MRCLTLAVARLLASPLHVCWTAASVAAGGSYLVDDASIAPDGHCQPESWAPAIERYAFADVVFVPGHGRDAIDPSWFALGRKPGF